MTTAMLYKEIKEVKATQRRLETEFNILKKAINGHLFEDLRPEYLKKLERITFSTNKGMGKKFSSQKGLKSYFKNL